MKVVVIGLGSIGKRHAKILLEHFDCEVFAFRSGRNAANNDLGIKEVGSWDEIDKIKPDVALITNPTNLHIETALKCASRGMHLFIEKPLSSTLEGIDRLKEICQKKGLTCYTAYCLRFHPVIEALKKMLTGKKVLHARVVCSSYLPDWRPDKDPKMTYSAYNSQGGGAILDLSHEFDYINYLFGHITEIKGSFGRAGDVTVDSEDYADAVIKTDKKLNVNLHINLISRLRERKMTVDFDGGYCVADLEKNQIEIFETNKSRTIKYDLEKDACHKKQMQYFFDNIGSSKMMNGIDEATILLEKILEFKHGKR